MLLRRPRLTLGALIVVALIAAFVGLGRASFDTAPDTIVDPGSSAFQHEIQFENTFGADPIVLLVTTDVKSMFGGNGLQQEIATEANLATQDNQRHGVQSVYGASSFATVTGYAAISVELSQLQQAQNAASQKAVQDAKAAGKSDADAQAAGQKAATDAGNAFIADQAKAHPELAQIGLPSATNPAWMTALFINPDTGQPKPKFAEFVPDPQHLLITARLNPNTNEPQINAIVASINKTLHDNPIPAARVTISGVPVLENAIIRALRLALLVGMFVGALSMLVLLVIALRLRARLLARLLPVGAGLLTVGLLVAVVSLLGYSAAHVRGQEAFASATWQSILATFSLALNPATLAAFPIALGLAVDYSVQFLYRYTQGEGDVARALAQSREGAGRATRIAMLCTVAGLGALMISGIPMVRQFGITMIAGAALAWSVARVLTLAALKAWPRLGQAREPEAQMEVRPPSTPAASAAAAFAAAAVARATPARSMPEAPAEAAGPAAQEDDDDVALFGLGTPQAAVSESSLPGAALDATTGQHLASAHATWVASAWPGSQVEIIAPRREVIAPEPATPLPAVMAASSWTPSPWSARASVEPGTQAPPPPIAAAAPPPRTEPDLEPGAGWRSRWDAADGSDSGDGAEDEADRPGPGVIPAALFSLARRRSAYVLAPALLLAMIGWIAFPFSAYQTDPEKLVSPNLPAFRDLVTVRQATGSSGELDLILAGPDVTSPDAINWVNDLQTTVERDSGGKIRPVTSLAKLLTDINGGQKVTAEQASGFMGLLPTYVLNALVDSQHHLARMAFALSPGPIEDQRNVIDQVLREVQPPNGYTFYAAGFTYLGISGLNALQAGQVILNVVGALLVLAALLAIYRRLRLALVAWTPTLLVAGWSTAALFILRQPLTPMTAVLGALVVAFGTEFAILWLERYREAVAGGVEAGAEAAEAASRAAGPGIILSGAALTLGFLALTVGALPGLSALNFDMPMVRDFGLVAAMDMVLAVVAALLVLPALVVRFGLAALDVAERGPLVPASGRGRRRYSARGGATQRKAAAKADVKA